MTNYYYTYAESLEPQTAQSMSWSVLNQSMQQKLNLIFCNLSSWSYIKHRIVVISSEHTTITVTVYLTRHFIPKMTKCSRTLLCIMSFYSINCELILQMAGKGRDISGGSRLWKTHQLWQFRTAKSHFSWFCCSFWSFKKNLFPTMTDQDDSWL